MDVSDILSLMAGMAQHRVAAVEVGELKLSLMPDQRQTMQTAASGLVPPSPDKAMPQVTTTDATKAVAAAQEAARALAAQRLGLAQQRTANSRRKAAGGIGPKTGGHVDALYQASKRAVKKPIA